MGRQRQIRLFRVQGLKRHYVLREWETLAYGEEAGRIPQYDADRLASLARRTRFSGASGNGVLDHGRHGLRARGVVGVLAARDCSLEILPKVDEPPTAASVRPLPTARNCLVHMLAVALNLRVDAGTTARLAFQRESLLEILIGVFCSKLSEAIRKGVPRKYVERSDDLRTLRGRLEIVRQLSRHAVDPSRLACRFEDFSEDHLLNRIMKSVVVQLSSASRSVGNQTRLRELAMVYADVAEASPSEVRWSDIVIDRTNQPWRELIDMARMFLQGLYQTTTVGATNGIALLFEMNALFEAYVGRLVARALAGTDHRVSLQGGRLHCLTTDEGRRGIFQTRPDVIIRKAGAVSHIIDAKWKRISRIDDDPKSGVSQADVYQMMAYAQVYGAPRLTLLFPHHLGLGGSEAVHARHRITGSDALLEAVSLDITRRDDIVDRVRTLLFQA